MDESTEETQARQAAALSGEIDQEVGENGVLVSGGGADARVLRGQEAPDAGAFRTPVAGGARRGLRSGGQAGRGPRILHGRFWANGGSWQVRFLGLFFKKIIPFVLILLCPDGSYHHNTN